MSPTTVTSATSILGFVQDNSQGIYNVAYLLGMAIVGIFALTPTGHDNGTIPGRIINVLQTVGKLFGFKAPEIPPVA